MDYSRQDLEDPCTVWDSVTQCYMAKGELKTRKGSTPNALSRKSSLDVSSDSVRKCPRQGSLNESKVEKWRRQTSIENQKRNLSSERQVVLQPGTDLRTQPPYQIQPTPKIQRTQKAVWNSNGSITVLEAPPTKSNPVALITKQNSLKSNQDMHDVKSPMIPKRARKIDHWTVNQMDPAKSPSNTISSPKGDEVLKKRNQYGIPGTPSPRKNTSHKLNHDKERKISLENKEESKENSKTKEENEDKEPSLARRDDSDSGFSSEVCSAKSEKSSECESYYIVRNFALKGRKVINLGDSLHQNKRR